MIDRLEMAAKLPENQDPVKQFAITQALDSLKKAEVVDPGWPENVQRPEPQVSLLDLDAEWLKQAEKLAYLFAKPLGQSKDQYMEGLPKLDSQPSSYKGRFDKPLIVQTSNIKLSFEKMLEISGVVNYVSDLGKLRDWSKDPQSFKSPDSPYVT